MIDPDDAIYERDESDNQAGPIQLPGSNLAVTSIVYQKGGLKAADTGTEINTKVSITKSGPWASTTITPDLVLLGYLEEELVWQGAAQLEMAAGGSYVAYFHVDGLVTMLRAIVDPEDRYPEIDESDNIHTATLKGGRK